MIGLTIFRMGGGSGREGAPTGFSSVASTNLEIKPQKLLTFSCKPSATLV